MKEENTSLKSKVTNVVDTTSLVTEIETLKSEVSNKITAIEAVQAELDALKVTNTATEAELAKYKAGEIVNKGNDPISPNGEVELNEGQKIIAEMLKNVTPTQKALYSK